EIAPLVGLLRGIAKKNKGKMNQEEMEGFFNEYRTEEQNRIQAMQAQKAAEAQAAEEMRQRQRIEGLQDYGIKQGMKAPQTPSSVREYEYAKSQGYKGSYADFAKTAKGGVTVNMPGEALINKPPAGYSAVTDPSNP